MLSLLRPLAALTAAATLSLSTPAQAGPLETPQGTWSLSGSAYGDLIAAGGSTAFFLNIAPGFGYFIMDNGELFAEVGFGILVPGGDTSVTFLPGFRYFFGQEGLRPYVQGALYVGTISGAGTFGGSVGGGVLLPIHDNIGIDLGLRANMYSAGGLFVLDLPFGALSVRAFIPPKR